jgi:hypothetical protein
MRCGGGNGSQMNNLLKKETLCYSFIIRWSSHHSSTSSFRTSWLESDYSIINANADDLTVVKLYWPLLSDGSLRRSCWRLGQGIVNLLLLSKQEANESERQHHGTPAQPHHPCGPTLRAAACISPACRSDAASAATDTRSRAAGF